MGCWGSGLRKDHDGGGFGTWGRQSIEGSVDELTQHAGQQTALRHGGNSIMIMGNTRGHGVGSHVTELAPRGASWCVPSQSFLGS
eukprot:3578997-Rhodomonas_salina.3